MALSSASFLRQKAYVAVALTHFCVDILNNGRTLLVALIAVSLGLTNAQVGWALLLYNIGSSLAQPLFGLAADRFGPRWLVVGGMGWMILFYSLAAVGNDWLALIAVTAAGLGSGAFHPTGTMVASQASVERRTQATAGFFAAGQLGLFVGPVLAGLLLAGWGRPGYLALTLLALVAFSSDWRWVLNDTAPRAARTDRPGRAPTRQALAVRLTAIRQLPWPTLIPLAVIMLTVNTVSIAAINFAPKLFTELGYGAGYVGWMAGLFMMGSAAGGLIGGHLADRFDGKWAMLLGILGSVVPLYLYIPTPDPWRFVLLWLAGFFGGMPHSILVVRAQALLPNRRALASGLTLGFMFFGGALGSLALGVIADRTGLALALQQTAVLPLIAAVAVLFLPRQRAR